MLTRNLPQVAPDSTHRVHNIVRKPIHQTNSAHSDALYAFKSREFFGRKIGVVTASTPLALKILSDHLLRTSGAEVNLHLHNSTPCTDSTVDSQDDTTGVV